MLLQEYFLSPSSRMNLVSRPLFAHLLLLLRQARDVLKLSKLPLLGHHSKQSPLSWWTSSRKSIAKEVSSSKECSFVLNAFPGFADTFGSSSDDIQSEDVFADTTGNSSVEGSGSASGTSTADADTGTGTGKR